ncbi:hypothetical protein GGX14DRAFT_556422 [Mycena pura]|uniref:LCCL domain-containing protein n=1 Tax=Mycena pura TaxID=153505 RepID=A0AAD7E2V7_9AGAR|nr:hypothetical protein GGX14DRAFT_556422 [Mycena pura]
MGAYYRFPAYGHAGSNSPPQPPAMQTSDPSEASSSSTIYPPAPALHHGSSTSKTTLPNFDIERTGSESPAPKRNWSTRIQQSTSHYPRIAKALHWFRGPRPKVDLPDPKPLLDIDLHIRGRRIVIPIETAFLRHTRFVPNNWLLLILSVGYIVSLAFFARAQFFLTPADSFIACNSAYWSAENGCGLDGQSCTPFNDSSLDFRCPAQCAGVILANPRAVGNEKTAFVPLIVGGGDPNRTYRGDSFICAAAIQSGIISNSKGGCGTL